MNPSQCLRTTLLSPVDSLTPCRNCCSGSGPQLNYSSRNSQKSSCPFPFSRRSPKSSFPRPGGGIFECGSTSRRHRQQQDVDFLFRFVTSSRVRAPKASSPLITASISHDNGTAEFQDVGGSDSPVSEASTSGLRSPLTDADEFRSGVTASYGGGGGGFGGDGLAAMLAAGSSSLLLLLLLLLSSPDEALAVVAAGRSGPFPEVMTFAGPEPSNALSFPTWIIHVASVVEWIAAMALVWKYSETKGNNAWKGLAWGMVPLLGGAMCACTWHFFYNAESLEVLVALQAFLTVVGNCTMWAAAYRIWKSSPESAKG